MTRRHVLASNAAEEAIIGALLGVRRDAFGVVEPHLSNGDFWSTHLGATYESIGSLWARGLSVTVPAVVGASVEVTAVELDPAKLERIQAKCKEYLTDADLEAYCKTVADFAARRRLKAACERAIAGTVVEGSSPTAIVDDLQRSLMEASGMGSYEPEDARDVAHGVYDMAKAMADSGGFPGVHTGLKQLDKAILGFCPGDMVVLAGRPGMGKSALLKDFGRAVAVGKQGCALFQLEMSNQQVVGRQISGVAKIPYRAIRTGQMSPQEWSRFTKAIDEVCPGNLYMDDRASSLKEIRQRSRRIRAKLERQGRTLNMVGVDYLQLIHGTKDSRQESISDISRGLKMLAKELNCTVVALAQLNRELERRDNKRPMQSDLRDSGAIEQDADVILFVYRDHVYNEHSDPTDAELIVGKNRNGSCGTIPLRWEPKTMSFFDASPLTPDAE